MASQLKAPVRMLDPEYLLTLHDWCISGDQDLCDCYAVFCDDEWLFVGTYSECAKYVYSYAGLYI